MNRIAKERLRDVLAIIALALAGLTVMFVILVNQRADFPEWLPGLGKETFEMKAEFRTAQAVTPGQGQSIDIAGVRSGEVSQVEVQDGTATVTVEVEPKYAGIINEDASILLRPKTGLNDMVLALDPGTPEAGPIEEGATIPSSQTEPNVNPDEFLAILDGDTRDYLRLLLSGGAEGFGGEAGGRRLSAVLRRFEPTVRDIGLINKGLAQRRDSIANGIHNFRLLSDALADNDQVVSDFVVNSDAALQGFANQEQALSSAVRELPGALAATRRALVTNNRLAKQAAPALTKNLPGAKALKPALETTQPFFTQTLPPIRDQIRPFTTQVYDPIIGLRQAVSGLGNATPPLDRGIASFNQIFDALARNSGGNKQSYLFWLNWLNRNSNSSLSLQDANGPMGRAAVLIDCNARFYAQSVESTDPFLKDLLFTTGLPTPAQIGVPRDGIETGVCVAP